MPQTYYFIVFMGEIKEMGPKYFLGYSPNSKGVMLLAKLLTILALSFCPLSSATKPTHQPHWRTNGPLRPLAACMGMILGTLAQRGR